MEPIRYLVCFLVCVGSFASGDLIPDQTQLSNVINELKSLRKVVEENRKLIVKQEKELKAVKRELEETRTHCRCNPNSAEQKLESGILEILSEDTINTIRIGEQSKIRRIVPPTYPPANQDEPIAFYAYMSAPMSNIGGHHTLIFDVIKTNSGHGLHPTAGVFTAPKSGIYVFTWTIRVFNNSYHGTELVVNGQKVGALIPHSGVSDNDTGSTSLVVHVNEGEDVFLRTVMISNNGGIHSDSNGYSSFSGWKLM